MTSLEFTRGAPAQHKDPQEYIKRYCSFYSYPNPENSPYLFGKSVHRWHIMMIGHTYYLF